MDRLIKVALIGVGYRGTYLLRLMQTMPQLLKVCAIADPNVEETNVSDIPIYNQGGEDYQRMINEQTPDIVVIASPWAYHIEQATYALQNNCHIALEIKPGLNTASEESEYSSLQNLLCEKNLRCYPLENVLFKREFMALSRMVEEGLLGDILHMRAGYRHDLRPILLDDEGKPRTMGEGAWRYQYYEACNADIYPTHGFAPLAQLLGLGYRDRMKSLYSQASRQQALQERLHPSMKNPCLGDVITTHICTEAGVLINLIHDTSLPRPRSLDWEIQGTRGVWEGDNRRIYIEGLSPREQWQDDMEYILHYEHPYWQAWGEEAIDIDVHHQGMDYIMLRAVLADLRAEGTYPATLSDLILWCSITPFSALSIAEKRVINFN